MKRSDNPTWLANARGALAGVMLPCSGHSEHEHGINTLEEFFGIDGSVRSPSLLEARRVRRLPPELNVQFYRQTSDHSSHASGGEAGSQSPDTAVMFLTPCSFDHKPFGPGRAEHFEVTFSPGKPMAAAWDGESFAIHVQRADHLFRLRDLHDCMQRLDVAIVSRFHVQDLPDPGNLLKQWEPQAVDLEPAAAAQSARVRAGLFLLVPSRIRDFDKLGPLHCVF